MALITSSQVLETLNRRLHDAGRDPIQHVSLRGIQAKRLHGFPDPARRLDDKLPYDEAGRPLYDARAIDRWIARYLKVARGGYATRARHEEKAGS